MKTITLTVAGFSVSTSFTTTVKKVTDPKGASKIVLDEMPKLELSLNGQSAESLDIVKGSQVTVTPTKGDAASFTLSVGQVVKDAPKTGTGKGSSCKDPMRLSNDF